MLQYYRTYLQNLN